jgi:predicted methyltransferase
MNNTTDIDDMFGGENYQIITSANIYSINATSSEEAQAKVLAKLKDGEQIVAVEHPTLAQVEVIDEEGYRLACE